MLEETNFEAVLTAAKSGTEWAWAAIYRELAGPVISYLRMRGASDPEDLASEVFLHAARDVGTFSGDASGFRSWVFVIAHRRLVDSWRSAGRQAPQVPLADALREPQGGDVEEEALDRLATEEMLAALERLTDDQRAVITLRIIGGLSLEETARVLGRRVGAIKALQHRAVEALRDALPEVE